MIRLDGALRPGGRLDRFNIYRIGARLILDRLVWDISFQARKQRKKLMALRNAHIGEKSIILCNGPSLVDVDFSSIGDIFTFGLNKINLLFDEIKFRPSAIVAVNPFIIEQNAKFFSETDLPLFLDQEANHFVIPPRDNIILLHSCNIPYFARDCSLSIFQGYTVTYVALQIAYHMGFSKVALVGCDHDYYSVGTPNVIGYNETKDIGHFCDDYFSPKQPWQYPDLKASEYYYDLARRSYEFDGRMIVNASTKTKLDVFPMMHLDDFIHDE